MRISHILSLTVLSSVLPIGVSAAASDCKCAPGDSCWPSQADFQVLNNTVDGNLIRGVPPGAVCYPDHPSFDQAQCNYVLWNWFSSDFHAKDPISIGIPQWANNSCPPIYPGGMSVTGDAGAGKRGCTIGKYPVYAVKATKPEHVQAVIKFAKQKNLRLNIKSTGHSFSGRSTAFGSISIWTHHLRGIQHHENFQPLSCPTNQTQQAFAIAAGERVRDVYEAADKYNAIAVAGSNPEVGIMGWFTGGGHGPLSSTYGHGVDNVLQATIVTPDGEIVTANECQHPDLFWAIRGGGGGTFGVVTEVVMKAYPSPTAACHSLAVQLNDWQNVTGFWNAVAYIYSELPRLKEGGMSGYSFAWGPPVFPTWAYTWGFCAYGKPNGTIDTLVKPVLQQLDRFNGTISYQTQLKHHPNFFQMWNSTIGFEPMAGGGITVGSRLIPASVLTSGGDRVARILQNITTAAPTLQGYFVANSANRGLNVSMNPAWRDATVHMIVGGGFADSATPKQEQAAWDLMTYDLTAQLKSLAPVSGAYFNEGDPYDPDWQYTYWGENYPRLRTIKKRYDPDSVLWCLSCVGSEDWSEQTSAKLCPNKWQ